MILQCQKRSTVHFSLLKGPRLNKISIVMNQSNKVKHYNLLMNIEYPISLMSPSVFLKSSSNPQFHVKPFQLAKPSHKLHLEMFWQVTQWLSSDRWLMHLSTPPLIQGSPLNLFPFNLLRFTNVYCRANLFDKTIWCVYM